jgi:hypothetical protein
VFALLLVLPEGVVRSTHDLVQRDGLRFTALDLDIAPLDLLQPNRLPFRLRKLFLFRIQANDERVSKPRPLLLREVQEFLLDFIQGAP